MHLDIAEVNEAEARVKATSLRVDVGGMVLHSLHILVRALLLHQAEGGAGTRQQRCTVYVSIAFTPV